MDYYTQHIKYYIFTLAFSIHLHYWGQPREPTLLFPAEPELIETPILSYFVKRLCVSEPSKVLSVSDDGGVLILYNFIRLNYQQYINKIIKRKFPPIFLFFLNYPYITHST